MPQVRDAGSSALTSSGRRHAGASPRPTERTIDADLRIRLQRLRPPDRHPARHQRRVSALCPSCGRRDDAQAVRPPDDPLQGTGWAERRTAVVGVRRAYQAVFRLAGEGGTDSGTGDATGPARRPRQFGLAVVRLVGQGASTPPGPETEGCLPRRLDHARRGRGDPVRRERPLPPETNRLLGAAPAGCRASSWAAGVLRRARVRARSARRGGSVRRTSSRPVRGLSS